MLCGHSEWLTARLCRSTLRGRGLVAKDTIIKLRVAPEDGLAIRAKAVESGMNVSAFVRSAALGRRLPSARQSVAIADAEAVAALTMALSALRRLPQTEPVIAAQLWIEARIAPIAPL